MKETVCILAGATAAAISLFGVVSIADAKGYKIHPILLICISLVVFLVTTWINYRLIKRGERDLVQNNGPAFSTCPNCGYDKVFAVVAFYCPQCGEPVLPPTVDGLEVRDYLVEMTSENCEESHAEQIKNGHKFCHICGNKL